MKKLCFILIFLFFSGFSAFGDNGNQEEIDFLLFLPNSSNQFVNEAQASTQLDNLAKYFAGRNLLPGQICVYGYAAFSQNNIDEMKLSGDRAVFVMDELQKRGVSKDLFSDPVAYGSVDLWGNNAKEADKSPNRRVRILLDGNLVTPAVLAPPAEIKAVDTEIKTAGTDNTPVQIIKHENPKEESNFQFPWKLLLALIGAAIIAAIIFFASKNRKSSSGETKQETVPPPVLPQKEIEPTIATPAIAVVATQESVVDLDEEIRIRAYGLYLLRGGQNGDAVGDWHEAVHQISRKYEADGFRVGLDGHWYARKTIVC